MDTTKQYCAAQVTATGTFLYVAQLPGNGGKDYGYVFHPSQAMRLTPTQAARFAAYAKRCAAKHVIVQW